MPLIYCVSVDKHLCVLMYLHTIYEKTTNPWYLKRIKKTWNLPQKHYPSTWNEILHRKIWLISNKKCRTNTGSITSYNTALCSIRVVFSLPMAFVHCRYCEKRREVLLDHVHEGYEQDWWLYTDWNLRSDNKRNIFFGGHW